MLEIKDIRSGYGKIEIIHGVDLKIDDGDRVSLIGRNGVGKTTLMKTIMGALPPFSGSIKFDGKDFTKLPPFQRAKHSIAFVEQGHGIFPKLKHPNAGGPLPTKEHRKKPDFSACFEYFPILKERIKQKAGTLSGGEQAMLSIARAMGMSPKIIILDEPSEGVQPNVVEELGSILNKINEDQGVTILLVEQQLSLIQIVSKRCYVMDKGLIVAELNSEELHDVSTVNKFLTV